MVDIRKIHLILCLLGGFCSNLFYRWVYIGFFKTTHWQPWI